MASVFYILPTVEFLVRLIKLLEAPIEKIWNSYFRFLVREAEHLKSHHFNVRGNRFHQLNAFQDILPHNLPKICHRKAWNSFLPREAGPARHEID